MHESVGSFLVDLYIKLNAWPMLYVVISVESEAILRQYRGSHANLYMCIFLSVKKLGYYYLLLALHLLLGKACPSYNIYLMNSEFEGAIFKSTKYNNGGIIHYKNLCRRHLWNRCYCIAENLSCVE